MIKEIYEFKNELTVFTYYLKFVLTLNNTIKLLYQTYLIHLMT